MHPDAADGRCIQRPASGVAAAPRAGAHFEWSTLAVRPRFHYETRTLGDDAA